jgi:hypothetical protein
MSKSKYHDFYFTAVGGLKAWGQNYIVEWLVKKWAAGTDILDWLIKE